MTKPASADRLEEARRGYASLSRGDLAGVVAGMPEDVEWRNPSDAIEAGTRRGRDGFLRALEGLVETFGEMSYEVVDSAEVADATALLVHGRTRGRTSGVASDQRLGHVFRFRGDRIVAFEWYSDPAEALRAIGAAEWAGRAGDGS
jgi:ketosteroid isomerase-like protein